MELRSTILSCKARVQATGSVTSSPLTKGCPRYCSNKGGYPNHTGQWHNNASTVTIEKVSLRLGNKSALASLSSLATPLLSKTPSHSMPWTSRNSS
ncbi:MAG: hypothetical protein EBQ67_03605 [Sphingobacteriia bacterium]|nr:hypothetical protein [Sphingobacteriia bacterium]